MPDGQGNPSTPKDDHDPTLPPGTRGDKTGTCSTGTDGIEPPDPNLPMAPPMPPLPLYRLLEFVSTNPPIQHTAVGGRVLGRININTLWDREIFHALADPQENNFFYWHTNMVAGGGGVGITDRTFDRLVMSRSPGYVPDSTAEGAMGKGPFKAAGRHRRHRGKPVPLRFHRHGGGQPGSAPAVAGAGVQPGRRQQPRPSVRQAGADPQDPEQRHHPQQRLRRLADGRLLRGGRQSQLRPRLAGPRAGTSVIACSPSSTAPP